MQVAGSVAILAAVGGLLWQQTRVLASERLYQTASDLEDHNDLTGAEGVFRRSINPNDLNGRAHFGLSRVLYSRGRSGEGTTYLKTSAASVIRVVNVCVLGGTSRVDRRHHP